jgi:hypothetical protein
MTALNHVDSYWFSSGYVAFRSVVAALRDQLPFWG